VHGKRKEGRKVEGKRRDERRGELLLTQILGYASDLATIKYG